MSRLKRDKAKKRLGEMLALASDEQFLIMVWAIDAIQSGRAEHGKNFLNHPKEARDENIQGKYHAHKWLLETLVNELFVTRKKAPHKNGRSRSLNCAEFVTLATLLNTLRSLENAEDGMRLSTSNVFDLMPKLGYRQFEWQRGFSSHSQIYRAMMFFGGELSLEYFAKSCGLTVAQFFNCGFAFCALCLDKPGFKTSVNLSEIHITDDERNAAVRLLARTVEEIRKDAANIRGGTGPVAYKQSVLRKTPFVLFENGSVARAPLINLIMQRITSGLYYDLVSGGPKIWREIGLRFETYCVDLSSAMLRGDVRSSFKYKMRKNFDTPDVLISDPSGGVRLVVECKAKKMSFVAKFSDNPMVEAEAGFSEIIKGVVQIWRFFSHCRRNEEICDLHQNAVGMVLTLDPWLEMSTFRKRVLDAARKVATQLDPDISPEDQKHVLFCSIEDLENTFERCSAASLFEAIENTRTPKYDGWSLFNVHQDAKGNEAQFNDYPFVGKIAEVNPGWNLDALFVEQEGEKVGAF